MLPAITSHCPGAAGGLGVLLGAQGGLGVPLGGRETPAQNGPCWGCVVFWDHSSCSPVRLVLRDHDGSFQAAIPPAAAGIFSKKKNQAAKLKSPLGEERMKLMCGHCARSLQNQRLRQIPGRDTEPYFLGACGPSPQVRTSSLQPLRSIHAGGIETWRVLGEGMLSTGGWSITCGEGLGKQCGMSPWTRGWIRLLIVPLQNICNYCTVFIRDPPFGTALARVGSVF